MVFLPHRFDLFANFILHDPTPSLGGKDPA